MSGTGSRYLPIYLLFDMSAVGVQGKARYLAEVVAEVRKQAAAEDLGHVLFTVVAFAREAWAPVRRSAFEDAELRVAAVATGQVDRSFGLAFGYVTIDLADLRRTRNDLDDAFVLLVTDGRHERASQVRFNELAMHERLTILPVTYGPTADVDTRTRFTLPRGGGCHVEEEWQLVAMVAGAITNAARHRPRVPGPGTITAAMAGDGPRPDGPRLDGSRSDGLPPDGPRPDGTGPRHGVAPAHEGERVAAGSGWSGSRDVGSDAATVATRLPDSETVRLRVPEPEPDTGLGLGADRGAHGGAGFGGHDDAGPGGHHDIAPGGHHDTAPGGHHDAGLGAHDDTDLGAHDDAGLGAHDDAGLGAHDDAGLGTHHNTHHDTADAPPPRAGAAPAPDVTTGIDRPADVPTPGDWSGSVELYRVGDPGRADEISWLPDPLDWDQRDTILDGLEILDADDVLRAELRAASVRGRSHRHYGTVRQDDYGFRVTADRRYLVGVVSDGVSSATLSHQAARIVARVGGDRIVRGLETGEPADMDWAQVVHDVASEILRMGPGLLRRNGFEGEATSEDVARALAATAVFAVVDLRPTDAGTRAHVVTVGDSAAWVLRSGTDWEACKPIKNDGAVIAESRTAALPRIPRTPSRPVELLLAPDDVLVLMTDGIGDPLGNGDTSVGRFLAECWHRPPPALTFAAQVDFARRAQDDDRTVLAVWPDRHV